ncbi:hypothetical protein KEHDKFFH_16665 [Marinobacter maroccanus]|uniref:Lipoprotein n=1 Tax=Marinobacter maroccanus TaxID=2055143 RepID=A0A2S5Z6R5_9GAMM|nr:hypothetical protein [Marinobacter maroccanus]PPI83067.1 hypothetical protein KEHDKFFH_16665 [Marinobacter maroccanus]
MRHLRILILALATLTVVGCTGEAESTQPNTPTPDVSKEATSTTVESRPGEPVQGMVRNVEFTMDQALFQGGTLEIRKGSDFFADLSVEIVLFDDDPAGKAFRFPSDEPNLSPHLRLSRKVEGQGVPDTQTLMSDYHLDLFFGEAESLGIPFAMKLDVAQHQTQLFGTGFATFGDIKVIDGELDTRYQSLDTLTLLAERYAEQKDAFANVENTFGTTLYTNGNASPATAFVGLEVSDREGKLALMKLQFRMEQSGWVVANELSPDQIHEAHAVLDSFEGDRRTVEGNKARLVAGSRFEMELQEQALIKNVRGTSVNCYLSEAANKASCRTAATVLENGSNDCFRRFYLLTHNGSEWLFEGNLKQSQKVDYKTGEIVEGRPPSKYSCSA